MTLTLELTPAEEARLAAARLNGMEPALLIKHLVAEHLPLLDYRNGIFLDAQESASPVSLLPRAASPMSLSQWKTCIASVKQTKQKKKHGLRNI